MEPPPFKTHKVVIFSTFKTIVRFNLYERLVSESERKKDFKQLLIKIIVKIYFMETEGKMVCQKKKKKQQFIFIKL